MVYDDKSIIKMDEVEHIRKNVSLYLGNTEDSRKIFDELIDNAFDEVLSGFANIVGVFIDTSLGSISILDNGRGFPFNTNLPVEKDPPILASTQLMTSGKFKKGESDDSPYKIAAGLHGIGLTAVNATSKKLDISIYRDKKHGKYLFENSQLINRSSEKISDETIPYSTKITAYPDEKYFDNIIPSFKYIEERLRLACMTFPNLKTIIRIDGKDQLIKGDEEGIIKDYLSKSVENWIHIEHSNKNKESYNLILGWDEESPVAMKILGCVNLVRVNDGVHINNVTNSIKNVFMDLAKKHNKHFEANDCLSHLRLFLNLQIINTSFDAQVKVKLTNKSDVSILDTFASKFKKYLDSNESLRNSLLERFDAYRKSIQTKRVSKNISTKKRSITQFSKLRDCINTGGELYISEGDSAIGGLIQVRDPKIHALLPLKGVIPNSITKKDIMENKEIKEIIQALGCGIGKDCDVSKLRYDKIILSADADPAGNFITVLLIILFARLMPNIIQSEKLFICKTPLFGVYRNKKFVPLWDQTELDQARISNEHILRFKGLGEFSPDTLKVFTLDKPTRQLIKVKWCDNYEKLFELVSSSDEKRKLLSGEWTIG